MKTQKPPAPNLAQAVPEAKLIWADVFATVFFAATVVFIVAWLGRLGIDQVPPEIAGLVRQGWAWVGSAAGGVAVAFFFRRAIGVGHVAATAVLAIAMGATVVLLARASVVPGPTTSDAQLTVLSQRLAEVRIEFFHTGESPQASAGTHLACYKDKDGPEAVCGPSASPIASERYRSNGGNKCGYNFYAVACMPNR